MKGVIIRSFGRFCIANDKQFPDYTFSIVPVCRTGPRKKLITFYFSPSLSWVYLPRLS